MRRPKRPKRRRRITLVLFPLFSPSFEIMCVLEHLGAVLPPPPSEFAKQNSDDSDDSVSTFVSPAKKRLSHNTYKTLNIKTLFSSLRAFGFFITSDVVVLPSSIDAYVRDAVDSDSDSDEVEPPGSKNRNGASSSRRNHHHHHHHLCGGDDNKDESIESDCVASNRGILAARFCSWSGF